MPIKSWDELPDGRPSLFDYFPDSQEMYERGKATGMLGIPIEDMTREELILMIGFLNPAKPKTSPCETCVFLQD